MPRKRRVEKLKARVARWRDLYISELMDFEFGWSPPAPGFERQPAHTGALGYRTWDEFLETWLEVRDDGLADWAARRAERLDGGRWYVERAAARLAELERDVTASESSREHAADMLAWWEGKLEDEEDRELPFAEELYQAVLAGAAPEAWAAERRRARGPLGRAPADDAEDDE